MPRYDKQTHGKARRAASGEIAASPDAGSAADRETTVWDAIIRNTRVGASAQRKRR